MHLYNISFLLGNSHFICGIYFITFENIIQLLMAKMQALQSPGYQPDNLYSNIKKFDQKELEIVSKYKGTFNEHLFVVS